MSEKPKKIKRDDYRSVSYELEYRIMRRNPVMGRGWNPMHRLEDAWDLVEAISRPEEGNLFNMSMCDDGAWTASFGGDNERAYGRTAAQAICYAALQSIGIEIVDEKLT